MKDHFPCYYHPGKSKGLKIRSHLGARDKKTHFSLNKTKFLIIQALEEEKKYPLDSLGEFTGDRGIQAAVAEVICLSSEDKLVPLCISPELQSQILFSLLSIYKSHASIALSSFKHFVMCDSQNTHTHSHSLTNGYKVTSGKQAATLEDSFLDLFKLNIL